LGITRSKLLSGLLAAVSVPGSAQVAHSPPAARVADDRVQVDYRRFTLPNGLTVIVHTDHSVPTVFVGVTYRIGSKDEPAGKTGLAHLFEHLMFQPTANRKTEFLQAMSDVGGTEINGSTTEDRTEYHETVPTGALDVALWMESDRMGYLAGGITQQLLDEQRGVVKNEKRQNEMAPGARAGERFQENYFPAGHPYQHSIIGSMGDLEHASLDDVKQWFEDHYGASNAVLVLSGDIDFEDTRARITRYFGALRPGKPVDRIDRWVPAFAATKQLIVYDRVGAANVLRSYSLPTGDGRRATLLQLGARTLAGSPRAALNKLLVDELHLATAVSATVTERRLSSSFDLSVVLAPGTTPEQLDAALDKGLATYFAAGPTQERLDAVVQASDMALLGSMENNAAIGGWLIDGEVDRGDPAYFTRQRQWIRDATATEVRALVEKCLSRPYFELRILPEPPLSATGTDVDRTRIPAPTASRRDVQFPPIATAVLGNGMKLVVAHRPHLPLVEVNLQFAAGSLADPANAPGTAGQALRMMMAGTQRRDADGIARDASRLGIGITAQVGAWQSGIGWRVLGDNLDQSLALVADLVRRPGYPQDAVTQSASEATAQFDTYERNPAGAAPLLLEKALWGADHPRGRIPDRASAARITREAIQHFHDHMIGPNATTLYMVGDITIERARALAERWFGDWPQVASVAAGAVLPPPTSGRRVVLIDAPGAAQTSLAVGELIGPFDKDRSAAEGLVDAALDADFQSRLNTNLRQRRGWSYGFGGGIANVPSGQRVFTIAGSVQTDKTAASMAEIHREIADFVGSSPITAAELDRERTSMTRSVPSAFDGNAGYLNSILDSASYGLPYNRAETVVRRLSDVTLEQARVTAAATYRPDALTWIVVGDLRLIEQDVCALNLGPVEVWDVYGKRLR
jgi:zinc protease